MKYKNIHRWNITPADAIAIQKRLAKNIIVPNKKHAPINIIAGTDVAFSGTHCCAAVCVFTFPHLALIEEKTIITNVSFPYIPTLFAFREGPPLLACFRKIKTTPDVIVCDGHGIAHPRALGLASHMGLCLNRPTIGCAKTPLWGTFHMPHLKKGAYSFIRGKKKWIGAVVRTRDNVKPIFVSPGYKISLADAVTICLRACTHYRIPEPLRAAHSLSKSVLTKCNERKT